MIQTRITPEEMQAAARQLAKTTRGRAALQRLAELMQTDELDLGFLDQHAFLALLGGVWSGQRERVRDAMNGVLSASPTAPAAPDTGA